MKEREKGVVFNIQRFSVHDGPGIRTTIFLKGCGLNCPWCSNPESIKGSPEILFFEHSCTGCKACLRVCPEHAIQLKTNGKIKIDRSLCNNCFRCSEICYAGALRRIGTLMSVDEASNEIEKDRPFFLRSKGGVTLSGGEPTLQLGFAQALLGNLKTIGLNTVIETCGFQKWIFFSSLMKDVDLVYYDLKIMDTDKHKIIIGTPNNEILENARLLIRSNVTNVLFRIPIIPGFTDFGDNLEAASEFLMEIGYKNEVELIPYHRFGEHKYGNLGKKYTLKGIKPLARAEIEEKSKIFKSRGFRVKFM